MMLRFSAFALALSATVAVSADPGYSISILTHLPSALNNGGTTTAFGPDDERAYIQNGGVLTDLGNPFPGYRNASQALNDRGVVVGNGILKATGATRSFRYENGAFTTLAPLAGGTRTLVSDVNASGVAVGHSDFSGGGTSVRAAVWSGSGVAALDPLAGDTTSYAYRINGSGMVLGASQSAAGNSRPVVWTNGIAQEVSPLAGDSYFTVSDLNDLGQVLGRSQSGGFIWQNGTATNLGALSAVGNVQPAALNVLGEAVGSAGIESTGFGSPSRAAFLYRNGGIVDLNSLLTPTQRASYHLIAGVLINDVGQIVVQADAGSWPNNASAYLLLTPNPVPEPASLAALGLGAMAMLRRRRKAA